MNDKPKPQNMTLQDIVSDNLDILFVGYNPGMKSAKVSHNFAHKSNRFWRLLYETGLTPYKFQPEEDRKMLDLRFGLTNIANRATKSANELTDEELIIGAEILKSKIEQLKPGIVCYLGIGVYKAFSSYILNKPKSSIKVFSGLQKGSLIDGVIDFVCSSPSGLNTIAYSEQVNCFKALRELQILVRKHK